MRDNPFPQVLKANNRQRFEYEDPEFFSSIKSINESFIVCWHIAGNDGDTHRLEAYPDEDLDINILMTGTFDECLKGLTRIHDAMIKAGVKNKMTLGSLASRYSFNDPAGIADGLRKLEKGEE